MKVSLARTADLPSVISIAVVAIADAYAELLRPATVESMLSTAYTLPAMRRRWEDHPIFVTRDEDVITGFADGFVEDDRVVISALCVQPEYRRQGVGRALVEAAGDLAPSLPLTADVVLGDRTAETFYEALGFFPGEILEVSMFGERVVERRWYHAPTMDSATGQMGASSVA